MVANAFRPTSTTWSSDTSSLLAKRWSFPCSVSTWLRNSSIIFTHSMPHLCILFLYTLHSQVTSYRIMIIGTCGSASWTPYPCSHSTGSTLPSEAVSHTPPWENNLGNARNRPQRHAVLLGSLPQAAAFRPLSSSPPLTSPPFYGTTLAMCLSTAIITPPHVTPSHLIVKLSDARTSMSPNWHTFLAPWAFSPFDLCSMPMKTSY